LLIKDAAFVPERRRVYHPPVGTSDHL